MTLADVVCLLVYAISGITFALLADALNPHALGTPPSRGEKIYHVIVGACLAPIALIGLIVAIIKYAFRQRRIDPAPCTHDLHALMDGRCPYCDAWISPRERPNDFITIPEPDVEADGTRTLVADFQVAPPIAQPSTPLSESALPPYATRPPFDFAGAARKIRLP